LRWFSECSQYSLPLRQSVLRGRELSFALRRIAFGNDLVVHQHAPFRSLAWHTFAVAPLDGVSNAGTTSPRPREAYGGCSRDYSAIQRATFGDVSVHAATVTGARAL
jgi:hypothetical protein